MYYTFTFIFHVENKLIFDHVTKVLPSFLILLFKCALLKKSPRPECFSPPFTALQPDL